MAIKNAEKFTHQHDFLAPRLGPLPVARWVSGGACVAFLLLGTYLVAVGQLICWSNKAEEAWKEDARKALSPKSHTYVCFTQNPGQKASVRKRNRVRQKRPCRNASPSFMTRNSHPAVLRRSYYTRRSCNLVQNRCLF